MRYLLRKGKNMNGTMIKRIVIDKNDDDTLNLSIEPVSERKMGKKDKDDDYEESDSGWCPPVTATSKDFSEAMEKISGILELKKTEGKKPKNIIMEFLRG